jgi:hypothetical protein
MKTTYPRQIKETNQIDFVLTYLKRKDSATTYELKELGIGAPAAVIKRLRDAGYEIATNRVDVKNANGLVHRNMAEYIFVAGPSDSGGAK